MIGNSNNVAIGVVSQTQSIVGAVSDTTTQIIQVGKINTSNYNYLVTFVRWKLLGVNRSKNFNQTISLDPANTQDRIDRIVLNTETEIIYAKKGTPSATPSAEPNTLDELTLFDVNVNANSTSANVTRTLVWAENTQQAGGEYNTTIFGNGIDADNTEDVISGTKSIAFATDEKDGISFASQNPNTVADFDALVFDIKLLKPLQQQLRVYFGTNTEVTDLIELQNNQYGFNANTVNQVQPIIIPLANLRATSFNTIGIANASNNANYLIDNINLVTDADSEDVDVNVCCTSEGDGGQSAPVSNNPIDLKGAAPTKLSNISGKNAIIPLTIPTSDGSGQVVHTSVHDFKIKWNGYRYWMVMTPYPNYNEDLENPEIAVSNDNKTWVVPTGLTNPIVPKPSGNKINSDVDLTYDYVNDVLWIMYREYDYDTENERFLVLSSTDGTTWTTPVEVIEDGIDLLLALSPSVVFDGNIFTVYYIQMNGGSLTDVRLIKRTSFAMDGTWSAKTECTISPTSSGKALWHLSANILGDETHLFLSIGNENTAAVDSDIYMAIARDGETFELTEKPIVPKGVDGSWDSYSVYQGSAVYDNRKSIYGFWYSAVDGAPTAGNWRIGYTEIQINDNASPLIEENVTEIDLSNQTPNLYNILNASSSDSYSVIRKITGGKAICRVNASNPPNVVDGVNISTFDFIPNRDMYMHIQFLGENIEYFFVPLYNTEQGFLNIGGSSFNQTAISLNTQGINPYGGILNEDDTIMYIAMGATIYQYDVVKGATYSFTYSGNSLDCSATVGAINAMDFNPTFNKVTVSATYAAPARVIATFNFTAGDISTGTLSESTSFTHYVHSFRWIDNGNAFACIDRDSNKSIKVYPCSTSYDISTVGAILGTKLLSQIQSIGWDLRFSNTKNRMYVLDYSNNTIYQYTLTTLDNPLTAIYENHNYKIPTTVDSLISGLFFSFNMDRWFSYGLQREDVYEMEF